MNKVITINLNGNAYSLEEAGYEALRAYLAQAARALEGNPDRAEILADIEQAIADKIRGSLGSYKTVAATAEVERIVAEMGPVDGGGASAGPEPASAEARPAGAPPPAGTPPRRLYKLREGAMIGGVCNGIAGYFGVDPTWVRLLFVALAFATFGVMAVAYLVMLAVVPTAETSAEKEAAAGGAFTAQEFIRRARAGYYQGMRAFGDKQAHREWRWKFKREMREWKRNFRREMRENTRAFRGGWHPGWTAGPRFGFGSSLVLAICSVCRWVLALVFVIALISLLCTGAVFGLFAVHGIPLWLAIVLLIVVFQLAMLPFKAMKHAVWGRGWGWPAASPLAAFFDAVGGLVFLCLALWVLGRIFPGVHEVLRQLPQSLREAGDSIRDWWNSGR